MEITPPTPRTPCVGNFASSTNKAKAQAISSKPARFTGSRCIAKSASNSAMPPNTPGANSAGMRELGVEAQGADDQQNEKYVGLDDAGKKFFATGHIARDDYGMRQRELSASRRRSA